MWTMKGQDRVSPPAGKQLTAKERAIAQRKEAKRAAEITAQLDARWASADRSSVDDTGGRPAHHAETMHPALREHSAQVMAGAETSQYLLEATAAVLAKHTAAGLGAHPKTPPAKPVARDTTVPSQWSRTQLTMPYTGSITLEDRFAEFFEHIKPDSEMTEEEAREAAWWRDLRARWDARVHSNEAALRRSIVAEVMEHSERTAPFA